MDLHVDVIKGGMATYGIYENAIFMPGLRDPQYSEWIAFSGVSVDLNGKQHYLNSQLSYERACHHAIDYLMKFGYTDIQAYMILGSAPIEGRFSRRRRHPELVRDGLHPAADLRLRRRPGPGQAAPGQAGDAGPEVGQLMAIYEYRCERDGAFDVVAADRHGAGDGDLPGVRGRGRAGLHEPDAGSFAPRALVAALDHEEKTRHEPEVVTSLPRAGRAQAHADGADDTAAGEAAEALEIDGTLPVGTQPGGRFPGDIAIGLDVVELGAVGLVGHHRGVDAAVLGHERGAALGVRRLQARHVDGDRRALAEASRRAGSRSSG